MNPVKFCLGMADDTVQQTYKLETDSPKAVLQIVHGALEHAMRCSDYTLHKTIAAAGQRPASLENAGCLSDTGEGFFRVADNINTLSLIRKTAARMLERCVMAFYGRRRVSPFLHIYSLTA